MDSQAIKSEDNLRKPNKCIFLFSNQFLEKNKRKQNDQSSSGDMESSSSSSEDEFDSDYKKSIMTRW